jgi:hypothetical protein
MVHKPKEFEQFIMKSYFQKQNHYKSFLRQLNIYGFERVVTKRNDPTGTPNGAYGHPLFVRGKPDLCFLMDRPKARKSLICNTKESIDGRHGMHFSLLSSMQRFGKPIVGLAPVPAASQGRTTYPTMSPLLVNESGNVIPENLVDDIIEVFGRRTAVSPTARSAGTDFPAQTHWLTESGLLPKDWLDPTLAFRLVNESARPSLSNDTVDEDMGWGRGHFADDEFYLLQELIDEESCGSDIEKAA